MLARSFAPIANADAAILILGSLPGEKSLILQQYYAHPQNIFWQIMEALFQISASTDYAARCAAMKNSKLALWDVCHSAYRQGSLDSAIQNTSVIPNNINDLLVECHTIERIVFNGKAAERLFRKHIRLERDLTLVTAPSTSPANAGISFQEKLLQWKKAMNL